MSNMKYENYWLDVSQDSSSRLAIGWLYLALGALVFGGVLTILIVLSRTPGIQDFMPWIDFFHTAIVVHVDLTVLVWFLSFAGVFWSLNASSASRTLNKLALAITWVGTVVFTASPFLGAQNPLMNNYVPVLQDDIFLAGLSIFGIGFTLLVIANLIYTPIKFKLDSGNEALRFGVYTSLVSALVALVCLALTYALLPATYEGRQYFELLFWGGGHALQFTHTQLMLVAWIWLAGVSGLSLGVKPRTLFFALAIGFVPVLIAPVFYLFYDITSPEYLIAFTKLMEYGGGIAPLIIGVLLARALLKANWQVMMVQPELIAMVCSVILFGAGGAIGYLISEINVTVPAHYHGSIVAVTLAFMGLTYYLLPRFGFAAPMQRLAKWQPVVYGGGQLMHVLGLAWSGGYGVQRKTAGAAQDLHNLPEILGMAIMGLGGLIAVVGGVLFLVIAIKSMMNGRDIKHREPKLALR